MQQLQPTAFDTGDTWRPRNGSYTSQTGKLTASAIDARDFQRARKDRQIKAHLPEGTLVAVAGGKQAGNPGAVIATLDKLKVKYDDVILVHGGGPGVEKIAARWAERNAVHQIICKPDWTAYGRAAPFRRNDDLLNLLPKGLIAFPGSGITDNLVDKARKLGIPVQPDYVRLSLSASRAASQSPARSVLLPRHPSLHRVRHHVRHRCSGNRAPPARTCSHVSVQGPTADTCRHHAAHCCMHCCPYLSPLTRRGGSAARPAPADIPPR